MKLNAKVGALLATLASTASVCYADIVSPASASPVVTRSLVDWVSLVAEILSLFGLVVFILYIGKFITSTNKGEEMDDKTSNHIKNGVMTSLVIIALCQAVIIVVQAVFVK
jgi:hypothetical protein